MTGASRFVAASALPPRVPGSLNVPHERSGVRQARHAFAAEMEAAGLPDQARDDAMLVLSELVSNAVRHAAPLPSGGITVHWSVRSDVVHLDVTDGGARTRPQAGVAALSSFSGRGLDIVRIVSRQWGVTEGQESVTVWADVGGNAEAPARAGARSAR
jgi:serine/threonine-protein kinase RsbW